jgi:hypothetical protein
MASESRERPEFSGAVVLSFPGSTAGRDPREPWLSERLLAGQFGVSTRTVRRWRVAGMPSRVFGGVRRYRLSECERWHASQESA